MRKKHASSPTFQTVGCKTALVDALFSNQQMGSAAQKPQELLQCLLHPSDVVFALEKTLLVTTHAPQPLHTQILHRPVQLRRDTTLPSTSV